MLWTGRLSRDAPAAIRPSATTSVDDRRRLLTPPWAAHAAAAPPTCPVPKPPLAVAADKLAELRERLATDFPFFASSA
jgi:hypothetical protein